MISGALLAHLTTLNCEITLSRDVSAQPSRREGPAFIAAPLGAHRRTTAYVVAAILFAADVDAWSETLTFRTPSGSVVLADTEPRDHSEQSLIGEWEVRMGLVGSGIPEADGMLLMAFPCAFSTFFFRADGTILSGRQRTRRTWYYRRAPASDAASLGGNARARAILISSDVAPFEFSRLSYNLVTDELAVIVFEFEITSTSWSSDYMIGLMWRR